MKLYISCCLILLMIGMTYCSSSGNTIDPNNRIQEVEIHETFEGFAEVTDVSVSGSDNQYTFNVTLSSPDIGCNHYADWWEVIDLDGNLLHRRTLAHSHVNEQPFSRLGGPVAVSEDTQVYIRAHMNTTSYGSRVFKGSVASGFTSENLEVEFAKGLEEIAPLPARCDF